MASAPARPVGLGAATDRAASKVSFATLADGRRPTRDKVSDALRLLHLPADRDTLDGRVRVAER